jgi:hypothetical protein
MTFVYRYYDQAELERQLNARAARRGCPFSVSNQHYRQSL